MPGWRVQKLGETAPLFETKGKLPPTLPGATYFRLIPSITVFDDLFPYAVALLAWNRYLSRLATQSTLWPATTMALQIHCGDRPETSFWERSQRYRFRRKLYISAGIPVLRFGCSLLGKIHYLLCHRCAITVVEAKQTVHGANECKSP
jgi:hypothetical protein